jgi:hypothetical protein
MQQDDRIKGETGMPLNDLFANLTRQLQSDDAPGIRQLAGWNDMIWHPWQALMVKLPDQLN